MIFQVIIINNLVDETYRTSPVIFRTRFRKTDVELKVREFLFDSTEIFFIENFVLRTGTIPIRNFSTCLNSIE
ncbi:hypothetical protein SDC9_36486 [bioreactor metagenome]|uniref:Uncharacterized protein n=1 Tax=bioreactor metagenome TaxID=1076179 RepID=A0A644VGI8_9ZZZZ